MWLMLQQSSPDDFVIATGETHSVQEFVIESLKAAGLEPDVDRYVNYDANFKRPAEVDILVGDPSQARQILGWQPKVNFESLVAMMVDMTCDWRMRIDFTTYCIE